MDKVEAAIEAKSSRIRSEQATGYAIVKRFIAANGMMHHGGTAINELVSDKDKFVGTTNNIDYDVFSNVSNTKQLVTLLHKLRKELDEAGYAAWFKPALHDGTQKVWAYPKTVSAKEKKSYPEILDATVLNGKEFTRLQELALREKKYRRRDMFCVPTAYIKMTAHLEFSRPQGFVERWRKVYPRCEAIYSRFPSVVAGVKRKGFSDATGSHSVGTLVSSKIRQELVRLAKENGWLLLGHESVKRITGQPYKRLPNPSNGSVELMVENIRIAGKVLAEYGYEMDPEMATESMLFPKHMGVARKTGGKDDDKCVVYESDFCYCYNEEPKTNGSGGPLLRVGCPDLVLRFMYARYIFYPGEREYLRVMIDGLNDHLSKARNTGLSRRFVVPCVGKIV